MNKIANSDGLVAVILARGNSKRILNKNLQCLGGVSLLERTIAVSHAAGLPTICSSDNKKILEIAASKGSFCIDRPKELAADDSTDQENFSYIWRNVLDKSSSIRGLAFLRPTLPFRLAEDISLCCKKFIESDYSADSIRTVRKAPYPPHWMKKVDEDNRLVPVTAEFEKYQFIRSQDLPTSVICDGHCDLINPKNVSDEQSNMYGKNVRSIFSRSRYFVDIDEPIDLEIARNLLNLFEKEDK